jgi:hypothetical protein
MLNDPIVIAGAARTPMGGFGSGRPRGGLDFADAKSASTESANGDRTAHGGRDAE